MACSTSPSRTAWSPAASLEYLARVSDLFGLSPLTFRRLKATHMGMAADDPYAASVADFAGRV